MHINSLKAYYEELEKLNGRKQEIAQMLIVEKRPMTDREIKDYFGLPDMNNVRPRITELIEQGVVREHSYIDDPITKKRVRRVVANISQKRYIPTPKEIYTYP